MVVGVTGGSVAAIQQTAMARGVIPAPAAAALVLPTAIPLAASTTSAFSLALTAVPTVTKSTVDATPVAVTPTKAAVAPTPAAVPAPTPKAAVAPKTVVAVPAVAIGARVVAAARTYFGVPYLYGGITRAGLDCSGLIINVMRDVGIKGTPRVSGDIANWTRPITRAQLQPGDLVFGVTAAGRVHHVGIFIGGNQMIDAANNGIPVQIHTLYSDVTRFGRIPV